MKKKQRSQACNYLLDARGAASCWIPMELEGILKKSPQCIVPKIDGYTITVGHLLMIIENIDRALELLGHTSHGNVN